jgi:hypothetical protein
MSSFSIQHWAEALERQRRVNRVHDARQLASKLGALRKKAQEGLKLDPNHQELQQLTTARNKSWKNANALQI